jgi:hypothetical protein
LLDHDTNHTIEHVHIYASLDTDAAGLQARNTAQWKEVFEEDIGVASGCKRPRGDRV